MVLASLVVQSAWALAPAERAGQLEISIGRGRVPTAEILGWVVRIDGERVETPPPGLALSLAPGPHTIALQVHYYRGLKTLVLPIDHRRFGFTFVAAGGRWVEKEYSVNTGSASVVRVDATLADDPGAIADHLVVAHSIRAASVAERPSAGARTPLGPTLAERVQERAAWVTALVSPQLVRSAGTSGDATVRVAVDRDGYLRDFHLQTTTGDALLDHHVEEVLRLAEPYPPFEGYLTLTLPFWAGAPLPDCPL
ncbi:MAG: TonB terminal [Myxococcaceae bacterium]|nr:TonB terminal [Myxococcaceae bacterium]